MIVHAVYAPGDRVRVWLNAAGWHRAVVVRPFGWRDGRGTTNTSYVVRLAGGQEMPCGPNSLRRAR